MSEEKEVCPKCGSAAFGILRDMTSRRVCKCGNTWAAPEKKDTGYKKLKRESEEYFTKWGEYMKRANAAEAKVEELKAKLEKAESVISFYASEDTWINKELDEEDNLIGWTQKKPNDVSIFPYSIGNSNGNFHCLGRRAREYMKGEG